MTTMVPEGKVYSGKRFVILFFVGLVVFAAIMMFGTMGLANVFGPGLKASSEKAVEKARLDAEKKGE